MERLYAVYCWVRDPTNLTAFSTSVIAAFTIVLVWVGYCQARLIRKSINLAREEFIASHRPRIILREINWEGWGDFHYTLVNVGETRATIIESWIMVEFVQQDTLTRPLRSFGHDDLGRLALAAGEMRELSYVIPAELRVAMMTPGTRRIGIDGQPPVFGERYFTGTIVYVDDNCVRRQSVFRRRWDDASRSFVRLANERDQEYAD